MAQSSVFCVMVGRLIVGFVWLNILVFCVMVETFSGVRVAQYLSFLRHGWETFSGVCVAQSLLYCLMVGTLLVGFVRLNI